MYFEQSRLTWWRSIGGGAGFPGAATNIVHAECDYRAPAFVHDQLEVRLTLKSIGRSSVTLGYELVNVATSVVLAAATTVNVTLDPETRKTIPVPEATRARMTGTPQ